MKTPGPAPGAREKSIDPVEAALGFWNCCANVADLWWSRHGGLAPVEGAASQRLRALVRRARDASPFYRRHYADLSGKGLALGELPTVSKAQLMASFDDWSTDRRVRRADVERFLADRARVGETFLGYHAWKSSGTSGTPGIFLQDARAMAVYDALIAVQFDQVALDPGCGPRLWAGRGRSALVVATGDHFASITSWEHLARSNPASDRRSFSVLEPTARLVAALNEYQPGFLASYPSVLELLAAERDAGRLGIAPALVWSGGEHLGEAARVAIEKSFGCRVMNEYGASECLSIAFGCLEGWMHLNSEWVILEAVDALGNAVAPGELSHSVLVTNLANHLQPIIRYDLGDRVTMLPVPCACGSPLPALRVEGRGDATVELRAASGARVRLAPLALSTVVEEAAGEHRFQIAQTAPDRLAVRFDAAGGEAQRARVWRGASRALRSYLASQSLPNVRVVLDHAPPRIDPRSGKLHAVTIETACRPKPR
jgi:phenylacetate-coenzyme A ligase PaaK-like adenylate-forming protein